MKLFCKDGVINTIAKDTHKDVVGFEILIVPDNFEIIESEVESENGVVVTYKTAEVIKQELANGS